MEQQSVLLAVNGTLMRGLELEKNLIAAKATFKYEAKTEKSYRLWTINDRHPAMIRTNHNDEKAVQVDVEVWSVPAEGLAGVLLSEPAGLSIGKVNLDNGETTLGVIGEPELVVGMKEISEFGGWRSYTKTLA